MSNRSASPTARSPEPWIDWGKALAAQCIVWHHLVHYGPLAPRLRSGLPGVMAWLDERALLAVQVFLVMGGYLAARSLWPAADRPHGSFADWPHRMAQRWRRLLPPYVAAVLLAVLAAMLARHWMVDDDTPAAPTLAQLAANLGMVQDVVDQPALSAGLWYVAIDLQLFALLAGLAALAAALMPPAPSGLGRGRLAAGSGRAASPGRPWRAGIGLLLLGAGALASLCIFNLQAEGDMWASYFFGSYALGVLAAWGARSPHRGRWAALLVALAGAGLLLAWRDRLALAAVVALVLLWQPGRDRLAASRAQPLMARLAAMSYALFLLHYPVSLAVNACFERFVPPSAATAALGLLTTWGVSMVAAWVAWRLLEQRAAPRTWTRPLALGRSGARSA